MAGDRRKSPHKVHINLSQIHHGSQEEHHPKELQIKRLEGLSRTWMKSQPINRLGTNKISTEILALTGNMNTRSPASPRAKSTRGTMSDVTSSSEVIGDLGSKAWEPIK